MPYVLVKIPGPTTPQSYHNFAVKMGFSNTETQTLKLQQYWATGLANTTPFLIGINGLSQNPMYGNVTTTEFPLFFSSFPVSRENLQSPIEILGQSFLLPAQVEFQVRSANPAANVVFTELYLLFKADYPIGVTYPLPLKDLEWAMLQH